MINPLKSLFQKEITANSNIPFSAEQLAGPIRTNRESLQLIGDFIDEEAFARSYFQYGVPGIIKAVINKPIDDSPTYTDLMTYIAKKYFEKVNYLEIGVSVGKKLRGGAPDPSHAVSIGLGMAL